VKINKKKLVMIEILMAMIVSGICYLTGDVPAIGLSILAIAVVFIVVAIPVVTYSLTAIVVATAAINMTMATTTVTVLFTVLMISFIFVAIFILDFLIFYQKNDLNKKFILTSYLMEFLAVGTLWSIM